MQWSRVIKKTIRVVHIASVDRISNYKGIVGRCTPCEVYLYCVKRTSLSKAGHPPWAQLSKAWPQTELPTLD